MDLDLRQFVNSGLMALFFLVVGLEARREFDMGELQVRSRVALPLLAGLGDMLVPMTGLYLAIKRRQGDHARLGRGAASTDTAFALGALALVGGKRLPDRVRTYLLTFSVVFDDLLGWRSSGCTSTAATGAGWRSVIGVALLAVYGVVSRRGVRERAVLPGARARRPGSRSGSRGSTRSSRGWSMSLLTCAYPAAQQGLRAGHRHLPGVP